MLLFAAAGLIVAGVALFVAAPFGGIFSATRKSAKELERERLEHERALAVQGAGQLPHAQRPVSRPQHIHDRSLEVTEPGHHASPPSNPSMIGAARGRHGTLCKPP